MPTVITDGNLLNMEAEIDSLFLPGTPANNKRKKGKSNRDFGVQKKSRKELLLQ